MDPLIITASPTDNVVYRRPEYPSVPTNLEEIVAESRRVRDAGAAVVHLHGPWNMPSGATVATILPDEGGWGRMTELVRESVPDLIVQFGVAGAPLAVRRLQMEAPPEERPEMASVGLGCHDYQIGTREVHMAHPRQEYIDYAALCASTGVWPEFEIFHLGNLWNFKYLLQNTSQKLPSPYWFSLFLGVRGGSWSPATIDELEHRLRYLPSGSVWQVVARTNPKGEMDVRTHVELLTAAISRGGHVRVGVEDNPFRASGTKASTSAELVKEVVELAARLGRAVASPAEARAIIGLPDRGEATRGKSPVSG